MIDVKVVKESGTFVSYEAIETAVQAVIDDVEAYKRRPVGDVWQLPARTERFGTGTFVWMAHNDIARITDFELDHNFPEGLIHTLNLHADKECVTKWIVDMEHPHVYLTREDLLNHKVRRYLAGGAYEMHLKKLVSLIKGQIVGYKGTTEVDVGYFYAPYVVNDDVSR